MVTDEPELNETSKTETVVRQYDPDGQLISETTTVVTYRRRTDGDCPIGMYL